MRRCDVCGNDDLDSQVACSGLGAVSFNYCYICAAIGAEPMSRAITFNRNDDMYYDKSDNHVVITLKSGKTFNTRSEYVTHTKSK
jgi:hypothetical protein